MTLSKCLTGLLLAAVAALANGCLTNSTCATFASIGDDIRTKSLPCSERSASWGIFVQDESLAVCSEAMGANCNPNDIAAIDAYALCIQNVPVCAPGSEAAFDDARTSCAKAFTTFDLTKACEKALETLR